MVGVFGPPLLLIFIEGLLTKGGSENLKLGWGLILVADISPSLEKDRSSTFILSRLKLHLISSLDEST